MHFSDITLSCKSSIREAMRLLDRVGTRFLLIADDNMILRGVITDGNIRRGLLNDESLDSPVERIMNNSPASVSPSTSKALALMIMRKNDYLFLPVVDERNCILDLLSRSKLEGSVLVENPVVLIAGGMGTRLGDLTRNCPKPLLKVGEKPILQTIIESFASAGFYKIFISVNYLAEMIQSLFKDGEQFGVSITYIKEEKRLGTAGGLSLIREPDLPCIVMNGDILTTLSPHKLIEAHKSFGAPLTMVIRDYEMQIPYGVVRNDGSKVTGIDEKPIQKFSISAGINILSPEAFRFIPKDQFFDMPDLYRELIRHGTPPRCYRLEEYWMDIGQTSDFIKANEDFKKLF